MSYCAHRIGNRCRIFFALAANTMNKNITKRNEMKDYLPYFVIYRIVSEWCFLFIVENSYVLKHREKKKEAEKQQLLERGFSAAKDGKGEAQ